MNATQPIPLHLRFRGVRGSIPSPAPEMLRYGGNTSCVEIRCGNEILILDAGTGIRNIGKDLEREFGAGAIETNILISHTHWDHIQGLPFFAPAYSPRNRIRIVAPPGHRPLLEYALREQMGSMHFPIRFDRMSGVSEIAELASNHAELGIFSIGVIPLNHPGGCSGFRIEANGVSVGYLPDHEPYKVGRKGPELRQIALLDFVRNLDLLILDTQYTESEYPNYVSWGHGSLPESVALALKANVRQLALFHHDPSHDDEQIDEMVAVAQELARGTGLKVFAASENKAAILESAHGLTSKAGARLLATA